MNKKTLVMVLLAVFLVSALAAGAEAAFKDALDTVFKSIENFFASGWKSYEKGLAFFLVFFLFFSSFLIGAKKAFGEISKPVIVFCFAAAAISGGILIVTNKFTLVQFGYVAFGLLFLMVTSAFYAMLMKVGLENHKFAAFFIAFFITGAIFFVGYLLSQKGGPLEFGGDIFGWLNDVTASFKGKGAGQDIARAKGDFLPEGQAPKKIEKGWLATVTGPFEKRPVTSGLVMVVVLLIFALMGGRRISGWFKKKGGQEDEARRQQQLADQEQPLTFDRLLEILMHYLVKKSDMVKQITGYESDEKKFRGGFESLKDEITKKGGMAKFRDQYSSWLYGGEGDYGPEAPRAMFWKKVPKLHRASAEFVGHLREFAVVEHFLPIQAGQIERFIQNAKVSRDWIKDVKTKVTELQKISQAISAMLKATYNIERHELHTEEEILRQLRPEYKDERTSVQWLLKEGNLEEILGKLIGTEIDELGKMKTALTQEILKLSGILDGLKAKAEEIKAAEQRTGEVEQIVSGKVTLPAEIADRTANISVP
ncbi:hypothetical protein HYV84_02125, partial [Candidatus Woesearchaeota archaeon]|nr:hypothetical protein [Candidatus Woesearchaeota archaeon]